MIDIKKVTPDTVRHKKSAKPNCSPPSMVFGVTVANKKLCRAHAITREHPTLFFVCCR